MTETKEILCEELIDYSIYPYAGKMKEIPAYRERRSDFEEANICIQNSKTGSYTYAPCIVGTFRGDMYITVGAFNKYWSLIKANILSSAIEDGKILEHVQSDINSIVNLAYAGKPGKSVVLGDNDIIEYKGLEHDIETQRLISKRASALDDSRTKFVYAKNGGYVHDRSCLSVEHIGYRDFEASTELPKDRDICPRCRLLVCIRNAIGEDNKKFAWYRRFMEKGNVPYKVIEKHFLKGNMKLHMDVFSELQVRCNEDNWIIKRTEDGKHQLYHNNYVMINETERNITSGFHPQKCPYTNVAGMLKYIEGYTWQKHLEGKKAASMAADNASDLVVEEQEKVVAIETQQEALIPEDMLVIKPNESGDGENPMVVEVRNDLTRKDRNIIVKFIGYIRSKYIGRTTRLGKDMEDLL